MNEAEKYPDAMSVEDVKNFLGIGREQAYNLVNSNQFHTVRVGRRIIVFKEVLIEWLRGKDV